MFSPKKALGVGLASAALLTGCGTETIGNSIVAPNGECIAGTSKLKLNPDQEIYIGADDLKVGTEAFSDDESPSDYLRIKNAGKGTLEVVRSKGDEGSLTFPASSTEVVPDGGEDGAASELSVDLHKAEIPGSLRYAEGITTIDINASVQGASVIELQLDTACAPQDK
ncbi:MAG TPA: hypothetical protein VFK11_00575 [Candidatus Saccharimonadales bacterium]|nr:hypothetical protein [Candidatus Saccharimonadales bacterium]